MNNQSNVDELKAFLDAIESHLNCTFDLESFEDRFRLQKYVLLAEDFGFDHGYRYGMHLRGPYSPPLAEDYYSNLNEISASSNALSGFNAEAFANLVGDKDAQWLEYAATFREFFRRAPSYQPKQKRIQTAIKRTVTEKDVDYEALQIIVDQLERGDVI
ncbi:hypothetical protein [Halorhabdus rudnickae]|uniref:hypothetical protein n=1 Tax=Halorhabdus rudnickae TaxID=1775544 RepID=UPI001082A492|nr:hypothetical protein [Halorhabdus rudnickae]